MLGAPHPEWEIERLAALRRYQVLDTPPEPAFDRITRLASSLLNVPIAVISFVDEQRQWFKSRVGIAAEQMPREHSFCGYTIAQDEVLEVPDAREDPRFADGPLVQGPPHLRFYAGAPLLAPEGAVGTLCIADQKPRTFSELERTQLRDLAALAQDALELRLKAIALRRADADLTQFAYVAAQELQEPLRTMRMFMRLLTEELGQSRSAAVDKYLQYTLDSSTRMQKLAHDLLSYSRIEDAAGELRAVDLNQLLGQVESDFKAQLKRTEASLLVGPLPTLMGHPAQLSRLFQCLLDNALKFHGLRPPDIRVFATRGASSWVLSVADRGIGIPAEAHERILGIFERLGATDPHAGTGLGLAVCRRIMELHGGQLELESAPGLGATFNCIFPDAADEPLAGATVTA